VRRIVLAVAVPFLLSASMGCLVLGAGRFYDDGAIAFDERLIGSWKATEDNVTAVVERSEWRSYRIQYAHPTERGMLTGYLFKHGADLYLDLTPVRGTDHGVFVVPGHALVRVEMGAGEVTLTPLSYDWFNRGLAAGTLPALLKAARADRDQVVIGSDRAAFWQWLRSPPAGEAVLGAPAVFRRGG
jgi:hypothetical protein